jgi:hypothetical protein
LSGGLEHLKIQTSLIVERFASVMVDVLKKKFRESVIVPRKEKKKKREKKENART